MKNENKDINLLKALDHNNLVDWDKMEKKNKTGCEPVLDDEGNLTCSCQCPDGERFTSTECNNLVEIKTYDEDGYFKGKDKVYCNEEDLCPECQNQQELSKRTALKAEMQSRGVSRGNGVEESSSLSPVDTSKSQTLADKRKSFRYEDKRIPNIEDYIYTKDIKDFIRRVEERIWNMKNGIKIESYEEIKDIIKEESGGL